MKVLFVCLGNICRSPTAEGMFRHLLSEAGLNATIDTDSAGTGSWHVGHPPDARAAAAAASRGIDISDLRARQFRAEDLCQFDYVIAMDRNNLADMQALAKGESDEAHPMMMSQFSQRYTGQDVPDPYYGGSDGFERVLDMLDDCCQGLLRELRRQLPGE